ncbi:hypothetical protein GYMLUDRAFT_159995 [Collybiopsis luxurians FD-317 M1]|nr:hypothetical protein GYMLUDRAFT_159995 [Collybiopsis luxurians FD-317 M1]
MAVSFLLPLRHLDGDESQSHFQEPPLDGSLNVSQIYHWHAIFNPDHPVFTYEAENGCKCITFSDLAEAIHKAAKYASTILTSPSSQTSSRQAPVAILAGIVDVPTYFCVILGLMHADIPCFPISPRNSPQVIAHLLYQTNPVHVLVSDGEKISNLAKESLQELQLLSGKTETNIVPLPTFGELFFESTKDHCSNSCFGVNSYSPTRPVLYVHSSGTSSYPKPIPWCHASLLQVAMTPYLGSFKLQGETFSAHAISMFHALGLNFIPWVAAAGFTLAISPPGNNPVIPTPESVLHGIEISHASFLICVPSFIEAWSQNPRSVQVLRDLKALAYAGGPLAESIGHFMIAQGVKLITLVGSTEVGVISALFSDFQGKDWQYFSINPHCAAQFVSQHDGTYELVVMECPTHSLPVINTSLHGENAYSTGDLCIPHSAKRGYWKLCGRTDDRITLSTGLKFNPSPLEEIINCNRVVHTALFFGTGHFQAGLLVFPSTNFDTKLEPSLRRERIIHEIWKDIQTTNSLVPSSCRIFKETVLIASEEKPALMTNKGTIRRRLTLRSYQTEIDRLFESIKDAAQQDIPRPVIWSPETTTEYVRTAVHNVLPSVSNDSDDIFLLHGCNSLQATWIRKTVVDALSRSPIKFHSERKLPFNLVYQYPSIKSLSQCILETLDAPVTTRTPHMDLSVAESLFTQPFTTPHLFANTEINPVGQEVFLITGSTGFLGPNVLAHLIVLESVQRIYVLGTMSDEISMLEKQKLALQKQGLPQEIAESPKIIYIRRLADNNRLKFEGELEIELRRNLTHIIHMGWPVNFNAELGTFRHSLQDVRDLIELSLHSELQCPPRFIFIGSIGTYARMFPGKESLPELPLSDSKLVAESGYSKSKWIAERIICTAAKTTQLRPLIVRLGQLCGSFGEWKTTEWFPTLVKSSIALGYLPKVNGNVSWVPVNTAAKAIVDMRESSSQVLNIVHPRPIKITDILEDISAQLHLQVEPYEYWLDALMEKQDSIDRGETSIETIHKIPALKILDFFCSIARNPNSTQTREGREAFGGTVAICNKAMKESTTLRTLPPIGKSDIESWLNLWKECNFL